MKTMSFGRVLLLCVASLLISQLLCAQAGREILKTELEKDLKKSSVVFPPQVKQFYNLYQFRTAWVNNAAALQQLWYYLEHSADLGLRQEDYQFDFICRFRAGKEPLLTTEDTLIADFRFSDAAIHFFRDVQVGNSVPLLGYNGLNYSPDWSAVPSLLASSLSLGQFGYLLQKTENHSAEYIALKNKIIRYNKILNDTAFKKEAIITSKKISGNNTPLIQKLFRLGIIDSAHSKYADTSLKQMIKAVQKLFYLPADGVLSTVLVKELNVPLPERVAALNRAINTLRWLNSIRQSNDHIIVVNIPSANLLVFERERVTLESKVIVGKSSNRTPTLCSKIEDVVLYPYWMVPKKIATKELLPLIKRNPGYLDANGYQVVNEKGRLVNPHSIKWDSLSTGYFPYTLRQSTGCDNSLGIVKLNFYNPFTVYLHDTPWKSLFNFNKRFFSHGCMRVEKAIELAKLILKDKAPVIDSLVNKGCLPDQDPIVITAREKMPVFVLYNTAWVDSTATVRFFEDVYGRFPIRR